MVVFKPPPNWAELLGVIKEMRRVIKAPVDTIGCHKLHDLSAPIEDQRYQILIALMLSSQTRDQCTAEAMKNLKQHGLTVALIHRTSEAKLRELIHPVCFHNNKASFIKRTTEAIATLHQGVVPESYKELVAMPGLGPKMVHLYLQAALGRVEGIGVDVHVHRIVRRFRWVPGSVTTPEETRKALEAWLPRQHWGTINELLVGLGQTVCLPRGPKCGSCQAQALCPNAFKESKDKPTTCQGPSASAPRKRSRDEAAEKSSGGDAAVTDLEDLCASLKCRRATRGSNKRKAPP
jgi:endonuclease-3